MNHSKNEHLMARKAAATPRGVGVMGTFFAERAQGAELWDVQGQRYIDFAGGIAVMNVGHGHPKVVAAIEAQLKRFTHTCYQVVPYESYVALAEKLNQLTPGTHAKKTALFSTGAEAIENAVKIARSYTAQQASSPSAAPSTAARCSPWRSPARCSRTRPASAPSRPRSTTRPSPATARPGRSEEGGAAPVQGRHRAVARGGHRLRAGAGRRRLQRDPARSGDAGCAQLCDEHGIVLIADEVQTGFGRTGKMFAMEHFGVVPDLMTIAKSLAAGTPLSAVTGRAEIMDAPAPGGLGGTYAGNPLAIAAAHAVIDVMAEEQLPERGAIASASNSKACSTA